MLLIISLQPKKFSENNPNKLVKRDAQRVALLLSVAHALASRFLAGKKIARKIIVSFQ